MDNKYLKYKMKYLQLKNQIGGAYDINGDMYSQKDIKYHGSPFKLTEIKIHTPRGDNYFNTQTGIYLTSNKIQAMLYKSHRYVTGHRTV